MKEKGIYINPREFRSARKIKLDLINRGELPTMTRGEPVLLPRPLVDHLTGVTERIKKLKSFETVSPNSIEITLPRTSVLAFIGDQHMGHINTDHDLILSEIEAIKNSPDTYVMFLGDAVDGIFWGGESIGEQVAGLTEQHKMRRSMFRELRGRVLVGFGGEHDSKWTAKSGPDAMDDFTELTDAPYIQGTGEITLNVGEQTYNIIAAHRLRGSSIYNNNHPQFRADREIAGADIIASAHTHRKAVTQQPSRRFGKAQMVTHVSVGPYKSQDLYSQRQGYPQQKEEQMGGVAIRVHADKKKVEADTSIVGGIVKWFRGE